MNRLFVLLDLIQPPLMRFLLAYMAGCASVRAGLGVLTGIAAVICIPVGLLWLTARLVWGW